MIRKFFRLIKELKFVLTTYRKIYGFYENTSIQNQWMQYFTDSGVNFFGNNKVENAKIGKYSYLAFNTIAYNCEIGRYCSIGPNCVIGFGDHPTDLKSTNPDYYYNIEKFDQSTITKRRDELNKKVIIGNDVWLGAGVFVKNGVKIGTGAVVGAGAVVLRDIPEYAIAIGVPAKVIKFRFSEEEINKLIMSKWWEQDLESI